MSNGHLVPVCSTKIVDLKSRANINQKSNQLLKRSVLNIATDPDLVYVTLPRLIIWPFQATVTDASKAKTGMEAVKLQFLMKTRKTGRNIS